MHRCANVEIPVNDRRIQECAKKAIPESKKGAALLAQRALASQVSDWVQAGLALSALGFSRQFYETLNEPGFPLLSQGNASAPGSARRGYRASLCRSLRHSLPTS